MKFYTYKKLQGSQTFLLAVLLNHLFYTYKKLQGSQTLNIQNLTCLRFYTYKKLQGSQTFIRYFCANESFTLIRNYKVLKLIQYLNGNIWCFTLIRNYKVLKHMQEHNLNNASFYTYKKLQGSQTCRVTR